MIETLAQAGSTNTVLAERLRAGHAIAEGTWLRAERQTAGRGRAGRDWREAEGNLYASTLVHPAGGDPPPHTLSLVAGLAVHDLLMSQLNVPQADPGNYRWLKWPNDLMVDGAKIAGILCERVGDAVIVGVGINVATAPPVADRAVTAIHSANPDNSNTAAVVLSDLARTLAGRLDRWRAEPLSTTLAEWEVRAHPRGAALTVTDGGERIAGAFDGLAPDGALRLALVDGSTRIIHAGDVELET
ncbi:biotin--[acetyl-CoA-carboxylase] ligase [Erythrobacter arachoides]|uniref:biotin--[biotin carboxyl-carrier protein] ligase n=1 Tax=Aurantiacibacter arachoides TaxID=1850444 RepID=A0A844ZY62_9SPHN|nr:biotin--[acetyl-CoA-carboxylase] ligase [Aurantiacibacter arachoides]MXO93083.1 biotin--[acetyl-CoA-carboxylase] ligase [Aurantiacibacter arachoides]GGD52167.1 biotin--[acetyl-CoA-carboxylase] ligase [Aurantiacibacter arachoides]